MANNGHDTGLEEQVQYLKRLLEEDPALEVCVICWFPKEFHITLEHLPLYWPAEHAIYKLSLGLTHA